MVPDMDPELHVELSVETGENRSLAAGRRATLYESNPFALQDDEFVAPDHEITNRDSILCGCVSRPWP